MRVSFLLVLLAFGSLVLLGASTAHATTPGYAEHLVAEAKRKHLAESTEWLRLGHYRGDPFSGYESEADGRPFFIDEKGKEDPERELVATLRAFFLPLSEGPRPKHALCRFPARFLYLRRELAFDPSELPRLTCPRFQEFMTLLAPDSVTLVFSAYYLNNPSSAFGHTFLRVNKRGRRGPEHNELLDYGVDFSAQVDTSNPVLYAFKGLTGLFPGFFRKVPYYFKVREYNDYESRDLWEYELDLGPEEVEMFAAHLWELGQTYFRYFYLSENCSYHVLGALEAASPRLELLRGVGWPVLPAETVRSLFRNRGLVRSVRYRPSADTVFQRRVRDLTREETDALAALVGDASAPLPKSFSPQQRALVLDAALDLSDSKYARDLLKTVEERDRDASEEKQRLLERRAEEGVITDDLVITPPLRRMPHEGHGTRRFALGSGHSTQDGFYHTARLRLALHDLGDPARGFPDSAQVEFLPMTFRYYVESPRLSLEEASLVTLFSLSPWTRFQMPLSWSASVGATRLHDAGCRNCLAGQIEVGGGGTVSMFDDGALLFLLGTAQVFGLSPIHDGIADLPLRAGVGPSGGLRLRFTDDLVAVVQGRFLYLPVQKPWNVYSVEGSLRYQYHRNFALGVEGRLQPEARTVQGMSYLYF